ncbi:MAG: DUF2726 domain-containing protein [Candidatus Nomurabacteria bacterium]|jgi:very-short-patch-repair endonuclease|nr:DUF2726 domain-containing protein [Candidatus Nomurabacteria bacterium]
MEYIFILFIVIAGIIIFIRLFGYKSDPKPDKPKLAYFYQSKKHIMTRSEEDFFFLLNLSVGDVFYIFPQVHLSTLLNEKIKGQNWKAAFFHINGKSVDFVLCEKKTLKPICSIELDDKSHEQDERKIRDKEVERILENTELPLIRISTRENMTKEKLRSTIKRYVSNS